VSIYPWHRQPEEGRNAYRAFVLYLHMSGRRSHEAVAEATGLAHKTITAYSHKYTWRARCEAYDDNLAREVESAKKKDRINAALSHAAVAETALEKISRRIAALQPEDIGVHQLPSFLDTIVKVHRQALGMASQTIEVEAKTDDPASSEVAKRIYANPDMVRLIDDLGGKLRGDVVIDEKPSDG
jgi:hypothetical protein